MGNGIKDEFSELIIRDTLIELSVDIESKLISDSGIAIKVAGKIVNKTK